MSCSFARGLYSLPAGVLRMRGACALPLFVVYLRNFPWLRLAGKVGWESPGFFLFLFYIHRIYTMYKKTGAGFIGSLEFVGLPPRGPNDTAQNLPTPNPSDRTG